MRIESDARRLARVGGEAVLGRFDEQFDVDRAVADGFIRPENRRIVLADSDPAGLIARLVERPAPVTSPAIGLAET